ncbi:MAG: BamA/TamA family outer membrane protein [Bacteroidota bacterium]
MRLILRYPLVLFTSLLVSGCLGTRYLKEDQKLLYKQKIDAPKGIDTEELSNLYDQSPNRRFPIIPFSPYVWFYYHGTKRYAIDKYEAKKDEIRGHFNEKIALLDSGKQRQIRRLRRKKEKKIARQDKNIEEGNVWMRWGEPVTVYSKRSTEQNIERFKLYLSSKGYFNAQIDTTVKRQKKKVKVFYEITPNRPYIIDTLFTQAQDSSVLAVLRSKAGASLLKKGANYDQSIITKERDRIDRLLKNNGYFDFSKQYISFDVDTAFKGSFNVGIRTRINNPTRGYHKIFHVDSINFVTDANLKVLPDSLRQSENFDGVNYRYFKRLYNKKVLGRRVFLEKDSLYNKENTFATQRQLANLDIFRFININYDSTGGALVANIYTSPLSRYQWSNEVGINVTQGFPGPFYNLSFKRRNVFKGMEILELNGRIGIEGVAPATEVDDVYASVEAGANISITFPQFVLPISARAKERLGKINPKTRLLAGFNYTQRPEYTRENFNLSSTYSWQNKKNTLFQFALTDVSIINSDITDSDFADRLEELEEQGNRLINSFEPSFVSSTSLNIAWNKNSYGLGKSNSSFFSIFFESGGTFLNFANPDLIEDEGLEVYQFLKANFDYRKTKPLNPNTTLAYRINAGIAKPYSSNAVLPYEKYFFAGGSNGIRAWRPRRLGPGSFTPLDSTETGLLVNYDFEQQGEILFEGSVELRKNLVGFIDYAFFMDFGNIWTIENDNSRPGSQFELDRFYREIALSGGFGLRFDFSFLVLRLDAGVKLHDPARPQDRRFIWSKDFYEAPFTAAASEPVVFNIGIGYPF